MIVAESHELEPMQDTDYWKIAITTALSLLASIGWYRVRKADQVEARVTECEKQTALVAQQMTADGNDHTTIMRAITDSNDAAAQREQRMADTFTGLNTEVHAAITRLSDQIDTNEQRTNDKFFELAGRRNPCAPQKR